MTAKEVYNGTKKFPFRLLVLNMICACVAGAILFVFILVGALVGSTGIWLGGAIAALVVWSVLKSIMQHYVAYMFKYGSVHAIAMAVSTGHISDDYFNESVSYIKDGFLKANAYLVVDKLLNAAVRGVTRLTNFVLGFMPDNIKSMIDVFINTYLDYIDECCLGWSMLHPNENVIKTSCDGVVIYYQNAKNLLAPAFKTTLRIVLTNAAIFILGFFFMFFPPLTILFWLIAYSIVTPFLNHRVLCNTMVAYLKCAENTVIQNDLYAKLNKCKAFKKMTSKIDDPEFDPAPGNEMYDSASVKNAVKVSEQEAYERDDYVEEQDIVGDTINAVKNSQVVGSVKSAVAMAAGAVAQKLSDNTESSIGRPMVSNEIPEPPRDELTEEQVLWQRAWNKMTPDQKSKYNNMDPTRQRAWKAQILKALFNYDLI